MPKLSPEDCTGAYTLHSHRPWTCCERSGHIPCRRRVCSRACAGVGPHAVSHVSAVCTSERCPCCWAAHSSLTELHVPPVTAANFLKRPHNISSCFCHHLTNYLNRGPGEHFTFSISIETASRNTIVHKSLSSLKFTKVQTLGLHPAACSGWWGPGSALGPPHAAPWVQLRVGRAGS